VTYANGDKEVLYFKDFNSGRDDRDIVARAKKMAIKDFLETGQKGLRLQHLTTACIDEFKENEDLPNTTNPDDWARISGKKGERHRLHPDPGHGQGTESGRSIDTVANTGSTCKKRGRRDAPGRVRTPTLGLPDGVAEELPGLLLEFAQPSPWVRAQRVPAHQDKHVARRARRFRRLTLMVARSHSIGPRQVSSKSCQRQPSRFGSDCRVCVAVKWPGWGERPRVVVSVRQARRSCSPP